MQTKTTLRYLFHPSNWWKLKSMAHAVFARLRRNRQSRILLVDLQIDTTAVRELTIYDKTLHAFWPSNALPRNLPWKYPLPRPSIWKYIITSLSIIALFVIIKYIKKIQSKCSYKRKQLNKLYLSNILLQMCEKKNNVPRWSELQGILLWEKKQSEKAYLFYVSKVRK